jgi:glycosyltransferase involved in cell wall biosynthesis
MYSTNYRPRVCINLPLAYPLFNTAFRGSFGGWEVRISLIARELAKRGRFDVVVLVGDYGQPHVELRDGVTLISWRDRDIWGIPPRQQQNTISSWNPFPFGSLPYIVWHRAQKRITSTVSVHFPSRIFSHIGQFRVLQKNIAIYNEINADIYVVPGNSFFSAETASYCAKKGKKYVFLSGSDMDYYAEFKEDPNGKDIYGMPHFLKMYCIEQAAAHIVQTERQAKMLQDSYYRSSTVIKNPIDVNPKFPRISNPRSILWVGKSDERVKRPSLLFELARRIPEFQFNVIMNTAMIKSHMEAVRLAGELPNITMIEQVPFEEIERYFADARIHLNTSAFEGFPNTYLQAAKYGVPTVAMVVDPDGMLSRHSCGIVCGNDLDRCEASLRQLMADDKFYTGFSQNSLYYVRKHHDKDLVVQKYEQALEAVLSNSRMV